MLIFLEARLAYLATPKTGTTAIETALRRRADIAFQRGRKHMPAKRYINKVAPFLQDTFDAKLETVALMRDPLEHLQSWYRYRTRDDKIGRVKSTHDVSFETFVTDVISDDPPQYARMNGQLGFLCRRGMLSVTHLFAYTEIERFRAFMSEKLEWDVTFQQKNVSPPADVALSPRTHARFIAAFKAEQELYDNLIRAGGYLYTPDINF